VIDTTPPSFDEISQIPAMPPVQAAWGNESEVSNRITTSPADHRTRLIVLLGRPGRPRIVAPGPIAETNPDNLGQVLKSQLSE
jgi:hypothetical protein